MASGDNRLADLIHQGVLLFSQIVPFPASELVAAVSAAAISKIIGLHKEHVSEILSAELLPDHISFVEPDDAGLIRFYSKNPLYPDLAAEFNKEISEHDERKLRRMYPFLYNALILKKQVPLLLFHDQIEKKQYRRLAANYEAISHGFAEIEGNIKVETEINRFAVDLLRVINDVYAASEEQLKNSDNRLVFEIIDYIREVAGA